MLIYKITNMVNGKLYVGQTTRTLDERKWQHINNAKKGTKTHLYNAMRKYGIDNFVFEKICDVDNIEDLNILERYYIAKYDCINSGYNMVDGGNNNVMFLDNVKKKHSESMRSEKTRIKISQSMKKYRKENPFTDEHRHKLSQSAMGNHNFGTGDTRSIACYCIDKDGKRYDFHSYKEGGIWWFDKYKPFGDEYHQVTYQRKIIMSINQGFCTFGQNNKKTIIDSPKWYRKESDEK